MSVEDFRRRIFASKRENRLWLSRLPIEEKIRMLVEMQERANRIREATGRPPLPVWEI